MKDTHVKKSYFITIIALAITLLLTSSLYAGERLTALQGDNGSLDKEASYKRFFLEVSLNGFFPSGSDFKAIYKSSLVVPGVNIGYFILPNLFVSGGFEFYKIEGQTPGWEFNTEMDQKIFSLDLGYYKQLSGTFGLSGELGLVFLDYTEKLVDLALENEGSCTGFSLGTGLLYKPSDLIGFSLNLSYTIAKDTLDNVSSDFGGFKAGLGLRLSL